ncbi:MAG TPA: sigma-70 family RNA polymerase sigma factor [Patescibacteria group bacterium]|nr:sigma-70 family RNA polymerase sigma factor [Patescibacteria group bacterium]
MSERAPVGQGGAEIHPRERVETSGIFAIIAPSLTHTEGKIARHLIEHAGTTYTTEDIAGLCEKGTMAIQVALSAIRHVCGAFFGEEGRELVKSVKKGIYTFSENNDHAGAIILTARDEKTRIEAVRQYFQSQKKQTIEKVLFQYLDADMRRGQWVSSEELLQRIQVETGKKIAEIDPWTVLKSLRQKLGDRLKDGVILQHGRGVYRLVVEPLAGVYDDHPPIYHSKKTAGEKQQASTAEPRLQRVNFSGMKIGSPVSKDEERYCTGHIFELADECKRLLEEKIIPAVGGQTILDEVVERLIKENEILDKEVRIPRYQKPPKNEIYKTGLLYYQLANRSYLVRALDMLITSAGHPGYEALAQFTRLDNERTALVQYMVERNISLVISRAKKICPQELPLADRTQEGIIGLTTGLDRYDPRRGKKLSTYVCWWIDQQIKLASINKGRAIRRPFHVSEKLHTIYKTTAFLQQKLQRDPEREELAQALGMSISKLDTYLQLEEHTVFLDGPIRSGKGDIEDETVADRLQDPREVVKKREEQAFPFTFDKVMEAMEKLPERERQVIKIRFGIDLEKGLTLRQAATQLGISYERVRQVQDEAIDHLREILDDMNR